MTTVNEFELIDEINILEIQNEDINKKLNNKNVEAKAKGCKLIDAKSKIFYLNRKVNVLKVIIIGSKNETMIRALAKEEDNAIVSYEAFEGTYMSKRGVESKCYWSINGYYAGAITKNSTRPILQGYINYKDNDWVWNDEGYLYYIGEKILKYKKETRPVIKMTQYI